MAFFLIFLQLNKKFFYLGTKKICMHLLDNNKQWTEDLLVKDPEYFKKLAVEQKPKYLMIGCSDSRVPLSSMFLAEPGEIFIHRNVANMANPSDLNFLSVLEYSVEVLQVKHIIVVGHYRCGGVAAAIEGVHRALVDNWIAPVKLLYIRNKKELLELHDDQKMYDRVSELNTIEQSLNILRTPTMYDAISRGHYPSVDAWIFDIYTGMFKVIDLPISAWKSAGFIHPEYKYHDD